MNMQRRKEIEDLIERVNVLKEDIESVMGDEQEYLDNMPENLQTSSRAELAEEAVSNLQLAIDDMESVASYLEMAMD